MNGAAPVVVRDLVKTYRSRTGEVRAVDGLSFEVPQGVIFGLLGPNGAGKTTTLRILTTLLAPTSGFVRVAGFDPVREGFAVRRSIAAVLQDNASEQFLSVRDNFLCYARLHGQPAAETERRLGEVAERFGLTAVLAEKAADLSIGMRRRVQVAKVFLLDSPILFLDEATTGMDPLVKREVIERIREVAREGRTVVLTTQNMDEAERLCDEILIVARGRAVARGDIETVKRLHAPTLDVRVSFEEPPQGLTEFLAAYNPAATSFEDGRLTVSLSGSRRDAATFLAALAARYRVADFEVTSASLEEAFLGAIGDPARAAQPTEEER
jgi:ABC-2 type transport system ATP-binding protein